MSAQKEVQHLDVAEVSLNLMVGLTSNHTMKLRWRKAEQEVVVLIDCGATHNFISNKVIEKLGLPLSNTSHYGVIMESGVSVRGKGMCKGIHLSLPGMEVIEDFLPLDLSNSNVILGMQWLSSMDNVMRVN